MCARHKPAVLRAREYARQRMLQKFYARDKVTGQDAILVYKYTAYSGSITIKETYVHVSRTRFRSVRPADGCTLLLQFARSDVQDYMPLL